MSKKLLVQIHLRAIRNKFRRRCLLASTLLAMAVWSPAWAAAPVRPALQPVEPLLDPQVREIIQTAVENVGSHLRISGYGAAAPSVQPTVRGDNSTGITETTVITASDTVSEPVVVEVDGTNAQTDAQANSRIPTGPANPAFTQDDSALAQHAAQGVSIRAPADWQVASNGPNSILTMSVPDVNFLGAIQSAPTAPFPQAMAHVLLRDEATTVLSTIDPAATALGLAAFLTDQQLLVTKVGFVATFEGEDVTGALYITSPGATAYLFLALAPQERWTELEATVDAVAQSIAFDDALMTWRDAEATPLRVAVDSGAYTLATPPGWHVTDTTDDNTWRAVLMAPGRQVAGALQLTAETPANSQIDTLFDGDLNQQTVLTPQDLRTEISERTGITLDTLEDEIRLMPVSANGLPNANESARTARLVGEVAWNGATVDAVLYLYPVEEGYLTLLLLGDTELIVQQEDALMTLFRSIENAP